MPLRGPSQPWIGYQSNIGCGVNILSSEWIVTAAHCVLNDDNNGYIPASAVTLKFGCLALNGACVQRGATKIVPHPCYEYHTEHDDIAMVRRTACLCPGGPLALTDAVAWRIAFAPVTRVLLIHVSHPMLIQCSLRCSLPPLQMKLDQPLDLTQANIKAVALYTSTGLRPRPTNFSMARIGRGLAVTRACRR